MFQDKKAVLIFGAGPLQRSIIVRAKQMGLYTVGIDPAADAFCRNDVDSFEIVGGQDYEGTCAVVDKYGIDCIVTAATDKPLVMMARVAEKYKFPFFSVETAQWSTDKYQMKQRFLSGGISCAKGRLAKTADDVSDFEFPVIVKPRDNSGSRGVKLCRGKAELQQCMTEALSVSRLDSVLVEEYIEGQEFSIESLHYNGKSEVVQFTEKTTTEFPYNVELGHIQPASISDENKGRVRGLIAKIGQALHFENCPSHTELKINDRGIFVIETSPRLGGDYITSTLTPLTTGINMEDELLRLSLGEDILVKPNHVQYAGVRYLSLDEGKVIKNVPDVKSVRDWPNVIDFSFLLHKGDQVNKITSSLNRYGLFIVRGDSRDELINSIAKINRHLNNIICS